MRLNKKQVLIDINNAKNKKVAMGLVAISLLGTSYDNIVNNSQTVKASTSYDDSAITSDDLNSPTPVTVNIDKNNFLNYFEVVQGATYDKNTGIITLTTDAKIKTGGVTLKNKVSLSRSFVLKGSVYVGDKLDSQGGADGLAIFLHPNRVGYPISFGGSVGMYKVPNAFGFKIDTYYNRIDNDPTDNPNPNVPDMEGNSPFGAFTYTDQEGNTETLKYEPTVQYLNKDNFLNKKAGFVPFTFTYNNEKRIFEVDMDDKKWVKTYDGNFNDLSLVISAATGESHNLQQVKLDTFSYSADPIYLAQQKSMDELKNEAENVINTINNDKNLSSDEKQKQIENVNNDLQKGLDNIQKQTTVTDVQSAENASKIDIDNQYVAGHPAQSSSDSSSSSSAESSASSSTAHSSSASSAESSTATSSSSSSAESSTATFSSASSAESSTATSSSASSAESSTATSSSASSAESSTATSSSASSAENSTASSSSAISAENSTAHSSNSSSNVDNHGNNHGGHKDSSHHEKHHGNVPKNNNHKSENKKVSSLPQTGDRTNQKAIVVAGLAISLIGLGMAVFGFKRNKK